MFCKYLLISFLASFYDAPLETCKITIELRHCYDISVCSSSNAYITCHLPPYVYFYIVESTGVNLVSIESS